MTRPLHREPRDGGETFACSLSVRELAGRASDWRKLRDEALIEETTVEQRIVAQYERREDVLLRLRALIDAEAICCPFLRFELVDDGDVLRLEVTGLEKLDVTWE